MTEPSRETLVNGVLALLLLAAPLIAHALDEPFYVSLATRVAILALAGVGLNLALGYGGMVSFGHAAFFGLGGYVAGVAAFHAFEGSDFMTWPLVLGGSDQLHRSSGRSPPPWWRWWPWPSARSRCGLRASTSS